MTLPKSLTTVTPLSKTLAMLLFITLPFLGFFAGINYQQKIDQPKILQQTITTMAPIRKTFPSVSPTPFISPTPIFAGWNTFSSKSQKSKLSKKDCVSLPDPSDGYSINYPPTWKIKTRTDGCAYVGLIYLYPPNASTVISVSLHNSAKEPDIQREATDLSNPQQKTIKLSAGEAIELSGIMNENTNWDQIGRTWKSIYIEHGKMYGYAYLIEGKNENYNDTFMKIVSSFRFLGQ